MTAKLCSKECEKAENWLLWLSTTTLEKMKVDGQQHKPLSKSNTDVHTKHKCQQRLHRTNLIQFTLLHACCLQMKCNAPEIVNFFVNTVFLKKNLVHLNMLLFNYNYVVQLLFKKKMTIHYRTSGLHHFPRALPFVTCTIVNICLWNCNEFAHFHYTSVHFHTFCENEVGPTYICDKFRTIQRKTATIMHTTTLRWTPEMFKPTSSHVQNHFIQ